MKTNKKIIHAFGLNEFGLIDLPRKISNVKISRLSNLEARGGCSICFPHGVDCNNSKFLKIKKNWKKHRKHQWK